jgi:hypothetical protein
LSDWIKKKQKYRFTTVILATQEAEDQEDCGSEPVWGNCLQDPISKELVEWLKW